VPETISSERLAALFRPRRIVMIGASERLPHARMVFQNLLEWGYGDRVLLVNRRGGEVYGRPAATSVVELGEEIDVAFLSVPVAAVPDALEEAAAAGIRSACLLAGGYAEEGQAGAERQRELVEVAERLGMTLLGPNCIGYLNAVDVVPLLAAPVERLPRRPGRLGVVAQSGGNAVSIMSLAASQNFGVTHVVTTGNEAMIAMADVMEFLVDDEETQAIALYVETLRKPEAFLRAAARANAAGKPVVIFKAGRSELGARTAAAHTGALVGDDSVIDAVLRQYGVIRVDSFEDVVVTAGLGAVTGPWKRHGVGLVTVSGGMTSPVADRAALKGLELPAFAPETVSALAEALPAFGTPQNPLDTTGAGLEPEVYARCCTIVAHDPNVGIVVSGGHLPPSGADFAGKPWVLLGVTMGPVPETLRPVLDEHETCWLGGIRAGIDALASISDWSVRRLRPEPPAPEPVPVPPQEERTGRWSEHATRELLAAAGVPVVPARLVCTAGEAAEVAAAFGGRVALKIVSADIQHKSDVGGVRLGVSGEDEVLTAYEAVAAAGGAAAVEGVLVAPMREPALELLVGVVHDEEWGQILAVAIGGVLVEVLQDSALRRLPVSETDVREMLAQLRGAPLLRGVRGSTAADVDALVQVILRVAALAQALAPELESLELNPLRVDGSTIEALDALVTWRTR